ncbi:MAG: glycosyltransferase family 4 protein [Armatimonadetes bacterium]|nr:glycosyltransferase family 4 protein [Armatimonadota bacterium]
MGSEIRSRSIAFLEHDAQIGGMEVNMLDMIPYLIGKGWHPVVICPFEGPLTEAVAQKGGKPVVVPYPRFVSTSTRIGGRQIFNAFTTAYDLCLFLPIIRRLKRYYLREKIDMVATNSILTHLYGGMACKWAGVPCVWHVGDIVSQRLAFGMMRRLFSGMAGRLPTKIIASSQAVSAMFDAGSPKVKIVHRGVDLDRYRTDVSGEEVRAEYGIPAQSPVVGIVGRLTPWKGHKVFLEAARKVRAAVPGAYFLVVGDTAFDKPVFKDELESYAQSLGLDGRAVFTGFRKDTPQVMAALDINILASIKPEPFGRVIIEAMALSRPVIATNQGGALEIIEDGVSGVLVPPSDPDILAAAILDLIHNPDKRKRIGEAARKRVEQHFSFEAFCQTMEGTYRSVVS